MFFGILALPHTHYLASAADNVGHRLLSAEEISTFVPCTLVEDVVLFLNFVDGTGIERIFCRHPIHIVFGHADIRMFLVFHSLSVEEVRAAIARLTLVHDLQFVDSRGFGFELAALAELPSVAQIDGVAVKQRADVEVDVVFVVGIFPGIDFKWGYHFVAGPAERGFYQVRFLSDFLIILPRDGQGNVDCHCCGEFLRVEVGNPAASKNRRITRFCLSAFILESKNRHRILVDFGLVYRIQCATAFPFLHGISYFHVLRELLKLPH